MLKTDFAFNGSGVLTVIILMRHSLPVTMFLLFQVFLFISLCCVSGWKVYEDTGLLCYMCGVMECTLLDSSLVCIQHSELFCTMKG